MPHSSGGGSRSSGSSSGGGGGGAGGELLLALIVLVCSAIFTYILSALLKPRQTYGESSKKRMVVCIIVCAALGAVLGYICFTHPEKAETSGCDTTIVINDDAGVIYGMPALQGSLERFRNETGVIPAIETVYLSQWCYDFETLEAYAYRRYLELFSDEKHWLVVVSVPDDWAREIEPEWRWQGMIGDDLGATISSADEARFTTLMQNNMLKYDIDHITEAFLETYNEFTPTVMETRFEGTTESYIAASCGIICAAAAVSYVVGLVMKATGHSFEDKKREKAVQPKW